MEYSLIKYSIDIKKKKNKNKLHNIIRDDIGTFKSETLLIIIKRCKLLLLKIVTR